MRKLHFLSMLLSLAFFFALGINSADGRIVTVQVDDSQGNPIQGATIIYNPGNGWYTFGTTDANGQATKDLADKTYQFKAQYAQSTSTQKSLTVDPNNTFLKFV
ncbi:carboxypeptidase-like regulatory domain-containing protein, partial [Arthrospira platensis SPKY1]|nr:carboxypeptidase-like regulatory domain-containing protein [Arthrospira platensis SPKY1]